MAPEPTGATPDVSSEPAPEPAPEPAGWSADAAIGGPEAEEAGTRSGYRNEVPLTRTPR